MLVGNSVSPIHSANSSAVACLSPEALAKGEAKVDDFSNAFQQCLEDQHRQPEGPGLFVYGMSRVLGQTLTRRLSNFVSCFGVGQFFPAQRDYPVLGSNDELARKFQPRLSTMNANQKDNLDLKPSQIRYEILPATADKSMYSVVYYVGLPGEQLPIPVLGTLYDWVRPVLYGSRRDWEAIQVDIDKSTQEPVGLTFETSNYANSPDSYYVTGSGDLHLLTKVSKMPDGTWTHAVRQKNGTIQTALVENPFKDSTHAALCLVAWNSSLDIAERVDNNSNLKRYSVGDLGLGFLDIETYRDEGFDLRATWVDKRMNLVLPARKS